MSAELAARDAAPVNDGGRVKKTRDGTLAVGEDAGEAEGDGLAPPRSQERVNARIKAAPTALAITVRIMCIPPGGPRVGPPE
jgi:hypothetical protein